MDLSLEGNFAPSELLTLGGRSSYCLEAPFSLQCSARSSSCCQAPVVLLRGLNFEVAPEMQLPFAILDAGGLRSDARLVLRVADVPEKPTGLLLNRAAFADLRVKENSKGSLLGTLSAIDEDKGEAPHTFSATAPLKAQGTLLLVNLRSFLQLLRQSSHLDSNPAPSARCSAPLTQPLIKSFERCFAARHFTFSFLSPGGWRRGFRAEGALRGADRR